MIGTTLAHFKVTGKLGEGGMGEVYRAEDTRLGRQVAIKVLPQAVAADPERLARFEREAKLLASLNHPHIAGIYQVEQSQELHFLVMELVDGEDLQERLARGPIPVAEALPLALQIAQALEAAHASGVIHRDLKPANVMLGAGGQVKILDFGLAKALDPAAGSGAGRDPGLSPLSVSPTMTAQMTQAGVILGTAAYMSPEQARGEDADKRADIWAFGILLFEMLTGKRSFAGRTVTDIIAAVVTRDPDWEQLPARTPNQVRRLLVRCTRKEKQDRLHDIADARIALVEAIERPELDAVGGGARRGVRWPAVALGVVAGLVAGAALWSVLAPAPAPDRVRTEPRRLSIDVPPHLDVERVAISRDARTVLFVAADKTGGDGAVGVSRVYLRPLGDDQVRELPGSEGAHWATFSPDGRWIAFRQRPAPDEAPRIRKVSIDGGPAITLLDDAQQTFSMPGEWRDDGRILIDHRGALAALPANGGAPQVLLTAEEASEGRRQVLLQTLSLPDGDHVLLSLGYQAGGNLAVKSQVYSISTGERRPLLDGAGPAIMTGDALVTRSVEVTTVYRFDPVRVELLGDPVPLMAGWFNGRLADDGTFVMIQDEFDSAYPVLADAAGRFESLPEFPKAFPEGGEVRAVRWSPDGTRLALAIFAPDLSRQLYTYDVERHALSRLGYPGNFVGDVVWSPDGRQIAFGSSHEDDKERIYVREWTGDGQPRALYDDAGDFDDEPADWSPDGSKIVLNRHPGDGSDVMVLDVRSGKVTPLVATPAHEHSPKISPDGRWVAFDSDEAGPTEIFVTRLIADPAGAEARKFRASTSGGASPVWSPDGKSIYFIKDQAKLMQVAATPARGGEELQFGIEREILDLKERSLTAANFQNLDLHPDGKTWVFLQDVTPKNATPNIQVVLGFDTLLRRMLDRAGT